MDPTVIVALISFLGTVLGTFAGVLTGSKLTEYRIKQLESKVAKHNEVVERTFKLEGQVLELQHDVVDLKKKNKFIINLWRDNLWTGWLLSFRFLSLRLPR